ncbi:uncharacterized protein LOC120189611 [Hibiscus syriacus]|uniref:uncharacterized protein LOC120189611 n=1 Tax=Hibiscus syriacus TaxID=106335 RepID=UPI0019204598|nr:uncharacterized protein LOC120189611 [Hibiscus syriacus]
MLSLYSSADSVLKNYIEPLSSTVVEPHVPKRGKGRPPKEKNTLAGSRNRFELLNSIDEAPPSQDAPQRKIRIASKGVDELKKNFELSIIQISDQIITVKGNHNGLSFVLSAIYGSNDYVNRRNLWLNLHDLDRGFGYLPWILGGDFNITLHPNESSDYELLCPFSFPDMKEFQSVTQDHDLHDHPFFGPLFTWSNKQTDSYLARKLDRILINSNWANSFPSSFVEFLSPGVSDHCMGIIWLTKDTPSDRPKPFKFFNFWTLHPNFLKVIEQSWQITFQGLDTIDKELQVQQELHNFEEVELLFLKKKAKIHWIKDGDKCSNFFHYVVAVKNKKDTIRMLTDDQGTRLETFDAMSSEVIDFFSNLIGKVDPMVKGGNLQFLKELLNYSISTETDSSLTKPVTSEEIKEAVFDQVTKPVTSEEIKEAVFDQGNNKAPGPDGYSPQFFKHSWPIIGEDVVAAIKHFFHHSTMLHAFNATTIILVPKIHNPSKVKDFRPISCCSVIYKVVSKILVKRLSGLLLDIISLNQTVFIKGISIVENTILAQELVKGYNKKNISPRCSLKIDLQKAFDILHWGFISSVLRALNLPQQFIFWIEACFTDARFSIAFNGSLIWYFKGARGIRQGDPLSPLLFVISMNVLSRLLNLAAAKNLISFHPKYKRIGLTHLSFADDLMIFCKGNVDSIIGVISVLEQFYEMSGLNLNASKCVFFSAGISSRNVELIQQITGFQPGTLPLRWKIGAYQSSVVQPNYWCRQFLLPHLVINKIEQLCCRFFWKGNDKSATGARVAWLKAYVLKGKELWQMKAGRSLSWSFRKILKLRTEAHPILQNGALSVRQIWKEIRMKEDKVPWHSLIWFPQNIPKLSLIAWMVVIDRLPTCD